MPLKFIDSDFLEGNEKYMLVLINCIESAVNPKLEPQVSALYDKYPHMNIYKDRKATGKKGKPGTIEIKGNGNTERFVISVMSQFYAGSNNFPNDNSQKRQQWFKKALDQISVLNHLDSIAIDGQMFDSVIFSQTEPGISKEIQAYIEMIDDFDKTLQLKTGQNQVTINIYNLKNKPDMSGIRPITTVKTPNKVETKTKVESESKAQNQPLSAVYVRLDNLDKDMVLSIDNFRHLDIVSSIQTPQTSQELQQHGETQTSKSAQGKIANEPFLVSRLPEQIPEWHNIFMDAFIQKQLLAIDKDFADGNITDFYPPKELVFNAFQKTPFNQIKIVILGQDCYHGPGEAMGLSFSVPPTVKVPPSLLNIYKELSTDIVGYKTPAHGDLTSWAEQGVLLLNSALTVAPKSPGSHLKIWSKLTDRIIELISQKSVNPIIFMLWGLPAKKKQNLINTEKHVILEAAHPSPLAANKGGWFGNHHFSTANKKLIELNMTPINW